MKMTKFRHGRAKYFARPIFYFMRFYKMGFVVTLTIAKIFALKQNF